MKQINKVITFVITIALLAACFAIPGSAETWVLEENFHGFRCVGSGSLTSTTCRASFTATLLPGTPVTFEEEYLSEVFITVHDYELYTNTGIFYTYTYGFNLNTRTFGINELINRMESIGEAEFDFFFDNRLVGTGYMYNN